MKKPIKKETTSPDSEDRIRESVRSILNQCDVHEDVATKLVDPTGLTPEEKAHMNNQEPMKNFRDSLPQHQENLKRVLAIREAATALNNKQFNKLIGEGVPIRSALEQAGLKMSEDAIQALEKASAKL